MYEKIDSTFTMRKGTRQYPAIMVLSDHLDELPLMLTICGKGDLPLWISYENKLVQVASIPKSPEIIGRLLKIYKLEVHLSDEESHEISDIIGLLDLEGFDWTQ